MKTFQDRIKEEMDERKLTVYGLAKFLGIPQQSLHRYLKSGRTPNGKMLKKISEKLEKSADWLLGDVTENSLSPPLSQSKEGVISVSSQDFAKLIDSHHHLAVAHDKLAEAHLELAKKCPTMHHSVSNRDALADAGGGGGRVTKHAKAAGE
jgi:transcriptional regulator with XRE-family HTH domain